MEPLHDVNGAARILAVSPWTIRAYIRQGKLRPIRIGRLVRLDEKELAQFVANSKAEALPNDTPASEEEENGR